LEVPLYGAGTRRHSGIADGDRATQNGAKATFSSVTTAAGVLMIGGAGYMDWIKLEVAGAQAKADNLTQRIVNHPSQPIWTRLFGGASDPGSAVTQNPP
jgi:hypothetical protein